MDSTDKGLLMRKSFQYMTSSCSMNFTWVINVNIDTIYWYDLLGWLVSKIHLKFHYSIMIVITHRPTKRQFAGGDWHFPMHFNSLAPGKFALNFRQVIFKQILAIDDWGISWNCPNMNVTGFHWWSVNIGSGNGLVPSGNKPLPEPMLTQISVAAWHH